MVLVVVAVVAASVVFAAGTETEALLRRLQKGWNVLDVARVSLVEKIFWAGRVSSR